MYGVANTSSTGDRGKRRIPQRRGAEAYERIREMILDAQLPQGSMLTEAGLVRELEMSRTPVREALHRLELEHYLGSVPGIGYIVAELGEHDMINAYKVRAVLEGLAAESAAISANRMDLARLEDLYDAMAEAWERGDDAELARLNGDFHRAIASASNNSYAEGMLDDIRDVFERFRATALAAPRRREEAHAEHGELIAALKARDGERAKKLAIEHVHRALEVRRGDSEHQHKPL
jgi:DNA-binding GntR family transcriptional regulator